MEKADKSSDDYDDWCKDAAETRKIIENGKQEVDTSSEPTSDPEKRKEQITVITVSISYVHWLPKEAHMTNL